MHIYRRRFFESVRLNQKNVITLTEWQHDPVVLLIRHNWTGNFWLQKVAHSILDQNKRQAMHFNNVLTYIFGFLILFFCFRWKRLIKKEKLRRKRWNGIVFGTVNPIFASDRKQHKIIPFFSQKKKNNLWQLLCLIEISL